jgi:hypothetical protein
MGRVRSSSNNSLIEHGALMLTFSGSPKFGRIIVLLPLGTFLDRFATHASIVHCVAASHVD